MQRSIGAQAGLASIPGPHRHRIYDRREEAPLPDGRRSGGDEGLGSRLELAARNPARPAG